MKPFIFLVVFFLVIIGGFAYLNHVQQEAINHYWQTEAVPHVRGMLKDLKSIDVDTSRAEALCFKPSMTENNAQACLDEIENEVHSK